MRPSASAREIETGTVYMNRCDYLDPGLAWTGVKDTGRGATLSRVGYESLTRPKSFHLRALRPRPEEREAASRRTARSSCHPSRRPLRGLQDED